MSKASPAKYENLQVANATLDAAEDRAEAAEARVASLEAKVAEQAHEISKMTANAWMPNDLAIKAENAALRERVAELEQRWRDDDETIGTMNVAELALMAERDALREKLAVATQCLKYYSDYSGGVNIKACEALKKLGVE